MERLRMNPVRFYFSFRSPFAGIALHRVLHCADFSATPFELIPVWPEIIFGGHMDNPSDNLFKLVYVFQDAARQADVAGLDSGHLRRLSARFALPEEADYRSAKRGVSTGPEPWEVPHGAFLYAQQQGREAAFAEAVFMRRFGFDGDTTADVLKPEVLSALAEQVGLDGTEALEAHRRPAVMEAIDDIRRRGERDGVFGVPFFVVEQNGRRESFWGNDHLEYLLRALRGSNELPRLSAAT
jgi:2-hydroxychromene-2-carboxylate isomerase